MDFTIKSVMIENFRCLEKTELELSDKTVIAGPNESGKSTIANAIFWCLFNKTIDNASNPNVVPIGKEGTVEPCVTLECTIDGKKPVTISRKLVAKKNRERTFDHYDTVCSINGVEYGPKKFSDYIRDNICDERMFRILMNPKTFIEDCPTETKELLWQAQRRYVMSICGIKESDSDLAQADMRWKALVSPLERFDDVTTYIAALKKQYAQALKRLASVNAKIEQQAENITTEEHTISEIEKLVEELKAEAARLKEKNEADKKELYSERVLQIREEIKALEEKAKGLLDAYNEAVAVATATIVEYHNKAEEAQAVSRRSLALVKKYMDAIKTLMENQGSTVCPECGQQLPEETLAKKRAAIEARIRKGEKLIEQENNTAREQHEVYLKLHELEKGIPAPVYPAELKAIQERIKALQNSIVDAPQSGDMDYYVVGMAELERKMEALRQEYARVRANNVMKQKLEQLETERQEVAKEISEIQASLDLANEFVSAKCRQSEIAVNNLFKTVSISLFEPNKSNDEIKETFVVRLNGVKYSDLSYSTKVYAGLEFIMAFQKELGISVPCIIDNCESISTDLPVASQMIFLKVKETVCPKCQSSDVSRRNSDGKFCCNKCNEVFESEVSLEVE